MDDVDPSDFLASPAPRSRSADSGGVPVLRWALVLLAVGCIPLGYSLLRSQSSPSTGPKSYTQAIQEEEQSVLANTVPAALDSSAKTDPEDLASEPQVDESPHEESAAALAAKEPAAGAAKPGAKEPSPAPASATSAKPNPVRYQVQSGDTLSHIAQRYGVRTGDIATANGMRGHDHIIVGQFLTIPNVDEEKARSVAAAVASSKGTGAVAATLPGTAKPNPKPSAPATPKPVAAPTGTVVLGPPAPQPLGVPPYSSGGLPAPTGKAGPLASHGTAVASGPRQVVLGPPVHPLLLTSGLPAGTGGKSSPPGRVSPLPSEVRPGPANRVVPTGLQESIHAASLEPVPDDGGVPVMAAAINRAPATDPSFKAGVMSYLVQPFDTLASIAKAHGTTQEVILQLNGSGTLLEGQTILLPISQNRLASPAIRSLDERLP